MVCVNILTINADASIPHAVHPPISPPHPPIPVSFDFQVEIKTRKLNPAFPHILRTRLTKNGRRPRGRRHSSSLYLIRWIKYFMGLTPHKPLRSPRDLYYRFGGKTMGKISNNGSLNVDYATSIAERTSTSNGTGNFRNGATTSTSYTDFDQFYSPINSYNQGAASGSYTVRTGDTLQGIASGLYGDSALWYKIAQANGISGNTQLIEGTTLRLPSGVSRSTNTANTFIRHCRGLLHL